MSFEKTIFPIVFDTPSDLPIVSWLAGLYMVVAEPGGNTFSLIPLTDVTARFATLLHTTHYSDILTSSSGAALVVKSSTGDAQVTFHPDGRLWLNGGNGMYIRLQGSTQLVAVNADKVNITAPSGLWVNGVRIDTP